MLVDTSHAVPCSSVHARRLTLRLSDPELRQLGLDAGTLVHVDPARKPRDGDLVWVELVRWGSRQRLIRCYNSFDGIVTLTVPNDTQPAIMRRGAELLVLGVVDRQASGACEATTGQRSAARRATPS